jgi:hypothetical protein
VKGGNISGFRGRLNKLLTAQDVIAANKENMKRFASFKYIEEYCDAMFPYFDSYGLGLALLEFCSYVYPYRAPLKDRLTDGGRVYTSDEMDILKFIVSNTREHVSYGRKIYTLAIVNKADDMQLDTEKNLTLIGEMAEMFEQVENTVKSEFDRNEIGGQLLGVIPFCALDAYLYRMVKKYGESYKLTTQEIQKIGVNEMGKKFSTLKPAKQEEKVYGILKDQEFIDSMIQLSGFSTLETKLRK